MASTALSTIINSQGGELLAANSTHDIRMEIPSSDGSKAYVIARRSTNGERKGRWECGCLGWVLHKNRDCKHLRAIGGSIKLIEAAKDAF